MKSGLEIPITWLLFGAMFACIGLMLLGDYRRIVLSKHRLVMSIKVLLYAVLRPTATMEYVGIFFTVISAWLLIAGMFGLAAGLGGL
jgi:hypothetical protein